MSVDWLTVSSIGLLFGCLWLQTPRSHMLRNKCASPRWVQQHYSVMKWFVTMSVCKVKICRCLQNHRRDQHEGPCRFITHVRLAQQTGMARVFCLRWLVTNLTNYSMGKPDLTNLRYLNRQQPGECTNSGVMGYSRSAGNPPSTVINLLWPTFGQQCL